MHELQPKTIKLKVNDIKELASKYNISLAQLPKIKSSDPNLPLGCTIGDLVRIERKDGDKINVYYRVVA